MRKESERRRSSNRSSVTYHTVPNAESDDESFELATDFSRKSSRRSRASQNTRNSRNSAQISAPASNIRRLSFQEFQKPTEAEVDFLSFVQSGNLVEATQFLASVSKNTDVFNVNKRNFNGYSALHIATHRQDENMIELLLNEEDIEVFDTFYHGIKKGSLDIVLQFIEFEKKKLGEVGANTTEGDDGVDTEHEQSSNLTMRAIKSLNEKKNRTFNSEFDEDITPLMLSAHCGHYDLIQFFFLSGERMNRIDDLDCATPKCKSQGELKLSYIRLNVYKAVSNPMYLCFFSNHFKTFDPIHEAFKLIKEMKKVSQIEPEVKLEYEDICKELSEFCTELLGLCRNDMEIEILLKQKEGFKGSLRETYPRLILAVECGQIDFVTHAHAHMVLYKKWTEGFEEWGRMSSWRKAFEVFWRSLLLPFISLWLSIYSSCWTCTPCFRRFTAPVSRFIHSLCSYIFFLLLLILETNLEIFGDEFDPYDSSPPRSTGLRILVEISIFVFALGHAMASLKQFLLMPSTFFKHIWNLYEVVNHVFFLIAFICYVIAFIDAPPRDLVIHGKFGREYWDKYHPLLIGESFYSMAVIMSFGRIFRALQVHSRFGPLQIALGRMFKSITKTFVPFLIIMFAFAAGLTTIYKDYSTWVDVNEKGEILAKQTQSFTSMVNAFLSSFYGLFGMAGVDVNLDILEVHYIVRNNTGGTELKTAHHGVAHIAGKILFGVYHVFTTTILLNTIVALMTGDAGEVFVNVDREWKMGRTEVWILYGRDMKVPAPFNTFALLRNITFLRFFGLVDRNRKWKRGWSCERCCYVDEVNVETSRRLRSNYSYLLKDLVQRYFRLKSDYSLKEPATLEQVSKVREQLAEMREKFKIRKKVGVRGAGTVTAAISKFKKKKNRISTAEEDLRELDPIFRN